MLSIKNRPRSKSYRSKGLGEKVASQKRWRFLGALKENRNFTRRKEEIKINYCRQRKCPKERYGQINEQGEMEWLRVLHLGSPLF